MLKKFETILDLCVSSLRRGHANLLCIVPIFTDDPEGFQNYLLVLNFYMNFFLHNFSVGEIKKELENPGFDPGASTLLTLHSTD